MFVHGSEEDGVLSGWIKDGSLELFLWFDGPALTQAQLTCGRTVAEWTRPSKLRTGRVRGEERPGRLQHPGSDIIDFDRQLQQPRLDALREAVETSELVPDAKALALAVLRREPPSDQGVAVALLVVSALRNAAAR